jgi:hypothetical protein
MGINWAPLFGECEQKDNKLIFKGGITEYQGTPSPVIGNFIADISFAGGTITAEVEFDDIDDSTGCSIIFYYDSAQYTFFIAGLGNGHLYSIRSFYQGRWTLHNIAGNPKNLRSGEKYKLHVSVLGSSVALKVNGVVVLSFLLPVTLPQSQIGIWCCSKSNITVENFTASSEDPRAFIIMQYTPPYNELYEDVISKICREEYKIKPVRSDEIYGPGIILGDIEKQIIESKLVIAEITPANPNVYYEVGFARALRKPTILIAEKGTKLPFDVSPFRVLFYENSISGKKNVEDALRKHLKAILAEGWKF